MTDDIVVVLSELAGMTGPQLKEKWRSLLGTDPPAYNKQTIFKKLCYAVQVARYGGLSEGTKARLQEIRESISFDPHSGRLRSNTPSRRTPRRTYEPGRVFTRKWNEESHELTVLPKGFQYQGRIFTSLSAAAEFVTGSHRSGPQFWTGTTNSNGQAQLHSRRGSVGDDRKIPKGKQ